MLSKLVKNTVESTLTECIIGSRVRMKAILRTNRHNFHGIVLDCGCRTGTNSQRLAKERCEVVGLDLKEGPLRKAKERYNSPYFVLGDTTRLPFRAGSFDFVICSDVLEHIPEDRKAMSEIARSIAEDGVGIFTVPVDVERPWVWGIRSLFGLDPEFWRDFYLHVRDGYRTEYFFSFLRRNGLNVEESSYCYGPLSSIAESFVVGILRRSSEEPKKIRSFELDGLQKFMLLIYRLVFPLLLVFSYLDFLIPSEQLKSDLVVVSRKAKNRNHT